MTTLFISDLHLSGERPEVTALFLRFLRERAPQAEALYILGDLFEAWIGDDLVPPDYLPVLEGLAALTAGGLSLSVMHGNRDFLLGAGFEAMTGCRLLPEGSVVSLYGRRALLLHGDSLCTDDIPYQRLRQQIRQPAFIQSFLAKAAGERIAFVRQLRETSREETGRKEGYLMDANLEAVAVALRAHGADLLIHGHTHRAGRHPLLIDGRPTERIVLGEWGRTGSLLTCDAADCRLGQVE